MSRVVPPDAKFGKSAAAACPSGDASAALRSAIESKFKIATRYGALPARARTGPLLIKYERKPGIF